MNGAQCPKCGSDQVMNDQCLKCGIVVSKYRAAAPGSGASPVSFVAAPAPDRLTTSEYSIPAGVLEREKALRKNKQQRLLVVAGIAVVVLIGGNFLFRFLLLRASKYSGLYKNGNMLFTLKFPETDSLWYHYPEGEPDSPLYSGVMDAFHRGKERDDPEITIGAWAESVKPVPERMDERTAARLLTESEEALLQIMLDRRIDCTITSSEAVRVGGNDGFRIDADIGVDGKPMKLIAIRGYNVSFGYWFFFSGAEAAMNANRDEVEGLLSTISFRTSVI